MPWLQEFGGWAGRPDCRSLGGGQAGHPFFPPPKDVGNDGSKKPITY